MIRQLARAARDRYRITRFRRLVRAVGAHPDRASTDIPLLERVAEAWANGSWAASPDFLSIAMQLSRSGTGPVLECGSGLSTILTAAATAGTGRTLTSLENSEEWAARVNAELRAAGFDHARVVHAPLKAEASYDWYDVPPSALPAGVTLVLCDGPPGTTRGGRSGLLPECWDLLADDATILLDDAARPGEQSVITSWTGEYPLESHMVTTARNPYAVLQRSPAQTHS